MEIGAIDIFHHNVAMAVLGLAEIVHGDDVRVIELRHGPSFSLEAFAEGMDIAIQERGQKFDRDESIQSRLPGFVDSTHPPLADETEDLKLGQAPIQFRRRGCDEQRSEPWLRHRLTGHQPFVVVVGSSHPSRNNRVPYGHLCSINESLDRNFCVVVLRGVRAT